MTFEHTHLLTLSTLQALKAVSCLLSGSACMIKLQQPDCSEPVEKQLHYMTADHLQL